MMRAFIDLQTEFVYQGEIVRAERIEEIGGELANGTDFDSALYLSTTGDFYVACQHGNLPLRIQRVAEQAAARWYVRSFVASAEMRSVLLDAISAYVPRAQRHGRALVAAYVGKRMLKQLRACARQSRCTPHEQLELFIAEGVAAHPARKRTRRLHKSSAIAPPVQLELLTTLVAVVSELNREPNAKNLSEAQRGVTALHRSLHSEEAIRHVASL